MLKKNERGINVTLKPEIAQKKSLDEQYDKVKEQSKHFDAVFWGVDYDVISSETQVAKKNVESSAQLFNKYVAYLKKKHSNVTVIVNNPCLEFWLLLHFEATGKFFDTCEGAAKQLKKHLPDYEKTSKYYTKKDNDIYLKLKPLLASAIANAEKLGRFDVANTHAGLSEMHLFFSNKKLGELILF